MTTSAPATSFTDPAPAERLEQAAAALTENDFAVEILDDAAAARTRVKDLIPEGAIVFTGASETLRLSGIEEDINKSGRYDSLKSGGRPWIVPPKGTRSGGCSPPDVIVGSVAAVTETGSLVVASASGSQLPATPVARPGDLGRRSAEGGARPEHRAAPRRRLLPPAGKRPRHEGLRAAQRHQPRAHPQRRTAPGARHRLAAPRSHRILIPPVARWPPMLAPGRAGRPGQPGAMFNEPAVVPLECDGHGRGRPVAVLGHDQVRLAGPRRLPLVRVLPVQQDHDVRSPAQCCCAG